MHRTKCGPLGLWHPGQILIAAICESSPSSVEPQYTRGAGFRGPPLKGWRGDPIEGAVPSSVAPTPPDAETLDRLQRAVRDEPASGTAHARLAVAVHRLGRTDLAVPLYERALALEPKLVAAWANLGTLRADLGDDAGAEPCLAEAVRLDPGHARAACNLGVVRRRRGDLGGAERALSAALQADPEHTVARENLAATLEAQDRPGEARRLAEESIARDPAAPLPRLVLARLALRDDLEEALSHLDALDPDTLPADLRARWEGTRGQALDRLGRCDEAGPCFQRANTAAAATLAARRIDADAWPAAVARARAATSRALASAGPPADDGPSPTFVLGFPRSGTTLTESVLAAHPATRCSDEAPWLEQALRSLGPDPVAALAASSQADRRVLREAYRAAAGLERGEHLVDKLPLNLALLGAIAALFPESPLVVVLRDPRDVAVSCFMQDFAPNPAMVQMLSIERIAAAQEQVMGLWLDHRDRLANPWLELRYEELVADTGAATAALLGHLGLAPSPEVERFWEHRRGAAISTPSRLDVARPVFRRAVGRHQRYEALIQPVRDRLDALAGRLGYPGDLAPVANTTHDSGGSIE